MSDWEIWFAWHPVRLNTGQWAWWTQVERRYDVTVRMVNSMLGMLGDEWEYQTLSRRATLTLPLAERRKRLAAQAADFAREFPDYYSKEDDRA